MNLEPLYGIRLRTPRLELRLPTHEVLVELREVARTGVHPPEEMPFFYAWTDEPYSEDWVVAFHKRRIAEWQADDWSLNLAVFRDSQVIGMQGIDAKNFAGTRTVETGSWLGMEFQGRGFGTEMRTAVLELAFRGLGAEAATSGAVDGNAASARIAEKLGYRAVGREEIAPRGKPVGMTKFALRRDTWLPPVSVEIEGLAPAMPLFGL